jgi:hypothetical protein
MVKQREDCVIKEEENGMMQSHTAPEALRVTRGKEGSSLRYFRQRMWLYQYLDFRLLVFRL